MLVLFAGMLGMTQQATAQQAKNVDGYSTFSYKELKKQQQLSDLSPETTGVVSSYTCTVACGGKELQEFACTSGSLTEEFHTLVAQCAPARCLCYFDKIIADGKPVKGFVIEVKK